MNWIKKNPSLVIALAVVIVAFAFAWPSIQKSNAEQAARETAAAKAEGAK